MPLARAVWSARPLPRPARRSRRGRLRPTAPAGAVRAPLRAGASWMRTTRSRRARGAGGRRGRRRRGRARKGAAFGSGRRGGGAAALHGSRRRGPPPLAATPRESPARRVPAAVGGLRATPHRGRSQAKRAWPDAVPLCASRRCREGAPAPPSGAALRPGRTTAFVRPRRRRKAAKARTRKRAFASTKAWPRRPRAMQRPACQAALRAPKARPMKAWHGVMPSRFAHAPRHARGRERTTATGDRTAKSSGARPSARPAFPRLENQDLAPLGHQSSRTPTRFETSRTRGSHAPPPSFPNPRRIASAPEESPSRDRVIARYKRFNGVPACHPVPVLRALSRSRRESMLSRNGSTFTSRRQERSAPKSAALVSGVILHQRS